MRCRFGQASLVVVVTLVAAVAGCAPAAFGCVSTNLTTQADITSRLKVIASIRSAHSVGPYVSAELEGHGFDGQSEIATWARDPNTSRLFSVNALAAQVSTWPADARYTADAAEARASVECVRRNVTQPSSVLYDDQRISVASSVASEQVLGGG